MRITATVTIKGDTDDGTDVVISPVTGITTKHGAGGRDLVVETAAAEQYRAQYAETKIVYDAGDWTRLVLVNE